jgi:hypothetical protein
MKSFDRDSKTDRPARRSNFGGGSKFGRSRSND